MNDWQVSEVRFTEYVPVWDGDGVLFDYLKYNENHDELGRFAETGQGGATSGTTSSNVGDTAKLPSDQAQAVARYTGKNSSAINQYLRFGTKPADKAEVSKDIATLDQMFADNPLPSETVVWRGINRDMIKTLGRAVDKGQGIFTDKGFVSTTRNQRFGSIRDVGYVTIELPKGSPALDVEPWSFKPEERETLIARGQNFAARRDPAEPNHFFLKLVPSVGKASQLLIKRREADRVRKRDDRFVWDASHVVFLSRKYNPNHDELGRFAEGPGGGAGPKYTVEPDAGGFKVTYDGKLVAGGFKDWNSATDYAMSVAGTTAAKPSTGVKLTGELLPAGYTVEPGKADEGGFNVINTEGLSVTHGNSGQQAVTNYFNSHPNDALPEDFKYVSGNILDDKGNVVFTQIDPSQKPSQVVEEFLNSPKMSANFGTSGTGYYMSNAGVQVHVLGPAASTAAPVAPTLSEKDGLPPGYTVSPNVDDQGKSLGDFNVMHNGAKIGQYDTVDNAISYAHEHSLTTSTAGPPSTTTSTTPSFVPGEEHLPTGVQLKGNQSGYSPFKVFSATGEVLGAGDTKDEALHDYFQYHPDTILPAGFKTGYDNVGGVPIITNPDGAEVYSGGKGQSSYTAAVDFMTLHPEAVTEDTPSLADLPETRFGTGAGGGPEALGTAGLPPGFNQQGQRGEATAAPDEPAPPSVHQLTGDEKQSIYSYTGSGNAALNKYLRDNITPDNPDDVSYHMKMLDQIFADTSSAKAVTLYRGISANAQRKLDYAIAHTDGHFVDPGFVSTSASRSTAMNWKDGTYVTIDVPKGSKALYVDKLSSHPGEDEWILGRNQHFTVSKDKGETYGYDHYFLKLINQPTVPKDTRQIELPFVDHSPVNKQDEPYDPNEKFVWDESGIVPIHPSEIEKFNPWHDLMGLFASGPSGGASVGEHGTTGSAAASNTTISEMLNPHGTPEQRDAVAYYTDEGYLGINQYLRYGKEQPTTNLPVLGDTGGTKMEDESTIKHLDEVLAHSSLPQETTVYRGLSPRAMARFDEALKSGDTRFIDKGYISTTANERYAEVFAQRMMQTRAIAEIVLPKGSHARDVSNWSSSPDEQETLVARGSAFKIERVERLPSGPHYHLRLLPEYSPNQLDLPLGKQMNTGDKYTWQGDDLIFFTEKFNPNHDELGRFASGPGGGGSLEGYSVDAKLVDGKIHTSNVDDALRALAANRDVVLSQPTQVSTLLDRLTAVVKDAAAKGEKAPSYDLCRVSVEGTNLFCGGSLGIPRVQMPQLAGVPLPGSRADALPKDAKGRVDLGTQFQQHLADMGKSVVADTVDASHLRASQNELDGARVARAYQRVLAGEAPPPTFISKDNYIVDGHHRWAGAVAAEYAGPNRSMPIKVDRVDMDIVSLLKEAKSFAKEWGLPQVAKFNPNHDEQGRFASGPGGASAGLDMAITSALKDKGGFTFNPVTVKAPDRGFAVGGYGTRDAYDAKTFVLNNVKEYLAKNRAALNDGNFLGGWIDKGKVYLDVTKVFPETARDAAIAAAKDRDQIAIADLAALSAGRMNEAFIDTGGTGKAEPGKRTMFLLDPRQMSEEEIFGALAEMIKQTTP